MDITKKRIDLDVPFNWNMKLLDKDNRKNKHFQVILTLTRCCTQNCTFCAVDALYSSSVTGCNARAHKQQLEGKELTPDQWCSVVEKLLAIDPTAEFDLSGGDCLALPWVSRKLIPFILERTQSRKQLSVTSTANSLQAWLEQTRTTYTDKRPGAIHVTFDGYRQYSFENIRLARQVRELGMDFHIECPLTVENCGLDKVHEIYSRVKDAHASELLLMRFFPVGRGTDKYRLGGLEPSANMYRVAIAEFSRLAAKHPDGPTIKVQCALKEFEPEKTGAVPCKMGDSTWCLMPNGILLICPWAYGMNGCPLDKVFVAGNVLHSGVGECRSKAHDLRNALRRKYSRKCRILAFIGESRNRAKMLVNTKACLCH